MTKKHVKDIKIFLKKKKKCQYHRERNKNLSEEQKQKQVFSHGLVFKYEKKNYVFGGFFTIKIIFEFFLIAPGSPNSYC